MKKILTLTLLAVLGILLFTAGSLPAPERKMVRLTRFEGVPFTGVSVSSVFNVEIYPSDRTSATVELPADREGRLRFEITADGMLTIGLDNSGRSGMRGDEGRYYRAKVYIRDLNRLKASGASDVTLKGHFETSSFRLDCSGASDIEGLDLSVRDDAQIKVSGAADVAGVIRAGSLACQVSGAADLDLNADAAEVDCSVSGGSDADMTITAERIKCNVSGGSDADLQVRAGSLWCEVNGGADINISGTADRAEVKASGAGTFKGSKLDIKDARVDVSSAASVHVGNVDEMSVAASRGATVRYASVGTMKSLNADGASVRSSR